MIIFGFLPLFSLFLALSIFSVVWSCKDLGPAWTFFYVSGVNYDQETSQELHTLSPT